MAFTFELQAAPGTSRAELTELKNELLAKARQSALLTGIREGALSETPRLEIDIDSAKATSLGLSIADVADTLTSAWAGSYVNDFVDDGRVKKVYIKGDAAYRSKPEDLGSWYVRGENADGETSMTPFSEFATASWSSAPQSLSRFNGISSYEIQGSAASGGQLRAGDGRDGTPRSGGRPGQTDLRLEWALLPGEDRRRSVHPAVCHLHSGGCSSPWRRCMRAGRCPSR